MLVLNFRWGGAESEGVQSVGRRTEAGIIVRRWESRSWSTHYSLIEIRWAYRASLLYCTADTENLRVMSQLVGKDKEAEVRESGGRNQLSKRSRASFPGQAPPYPPGRTIAQAILPGIVAWSSAGATCPIIGFL